MPGSSGLFSSAMADTESDWVARSLRRGQSNDGISMIIPKNSMNVGSEHEISIVAVSNTTTTGSGIGVVLVVGPFVVVINAEGVCVSGGAAVIVGVDASELLVEFVVEVRLIDDEGRVEVLRLIVGVVVVLAFVLFVIFTEEVELDDEATVVEVPITLVVVMTSVSVRTGAAVVVVLAFVLFVIFTEEVKLDDEATVVVKVLRPTGSLVVVIMRPSESVVVVVVDTGDGILELVVISGILVDVVGMCVVDVVGNMQTLEASCMAVEHSLHVDAPDSGLYVPRPQLLQ